MSSELDKLHDIIVPEPISLWPATAGWLILLVLLISFAIPLALIAYQHYRAAVYRREALRELKAIRQIENNQLQMQQLFALLKRTALSAYPREQVAQLTGAAWCDFLTLHSGVDLSSRSLQNDAQALYHPEFSPGKESTERLFYLVSCWIKQHKRVGHADF